MSWIGLLLVGIGTTDLVCSLLRRPRLAEVAGALTVLVLGPAAGLTSARELASVVVVAAVTVAWGRSVTRAFGTGPPALPLALLGVVLVVAVALSGAAPATGGLLRDWLAGSGLEALASFDPDRALLLAGAVLVQLSTGNVVVRLVLAASGTANPIRSGPGAPVPTLKGGRLLGPMERLVILGLGLAGEVTAAGIVIAAKGLLRFPELQATRREGHRGPGIHEVTEYFLVGSFVSWLVSLASLALLAA
ncbi:hypothetical protein [Nocardioides sp. W7]|uniref:hypothetical protein n=1 Tax=Nocardioides sp. W7 TaxID=2931390 RepID=UPI001FD1564C|nr:hypothetical protein [Nocardioides sp. W7]